MNNVMTNVMIKLDEEILEILKRISGMTLTNYEIKDGFIDIEGLRIALRDLMYEYDSLEEEYHDLQERYTDRYFGME